MNITQFEATGFYDMFRVIDTVSGGYFSLFFIFAFFIIVGMIAYRRGYKLSSSLFVSSFVTAFVSYLLGSIGLVAGWIIQLFVSLTLLTSAFILYSIFSKN